MKSLKQLSIAETSTEEAGSTRQKREKGWRDTVKEECMVRYRDTNAKCVHKRWRGGWEGRVVLPFDTVGAGCSDCETA